MKNSIIFLMGLFLILPVFADSWDNGDDSGSGATELAISTNLASHGTHTLSNLVTDTSDWFSFELDAGKRYRFESTGPSDTKAELFEDADGNFIAAENDDKGENLNFQLLYVPSETGTYYLRVSDAIAGSDSSASYELHYIEEPLLDSWDSGDDDYLTAPSLEPMPIELLHGPHTLSVADEHDWFHFHLIAGTEYTFSAKNFGWDTVGTLYQDGTFPVASGDDEGVGDNNLNFIIIFTPDSTGEYYLKVHGYNAGSELNYDLQYVISGNPDADGDGMLDTWEMGYLGGTNALPDADVDADTLTNFEEYIAGTDPTNSASFFAVTNWSTGSFVIEWPVAAGRVYRVYWAESLTNGFSQVGPVINYPQNSYTDTNHNAQTSGFYKVDVQLVP